MSTKTNNEIIGFLLEKNERDVEQLNNKMRDWRGMANRAADKLKEEREHSAKLQRQLDRIRKLRSAERAQQRAEKNE